MGCTKVSHPPYALSTDIQRDCPHLPYRKPKKPSRNMHFILRDRHLGGKFHPHWKWFYAVLLTKSFLPTKSQANYLEHHSQLKPRYLCNDTKTATAGALKAAYFSSCRSYITTAVTWNGDSILYIQRYSMAIPKSLISKSTQSVGGSMSPSRYSRTYKQHSGQIWTQFSPEGTYCKAAGIYQKPQVFLFSWLSKQPLGKPFEEYTNSCLFIF